MRLFPFPLALLALTGCEVGPDYAKPSTPIPVAYQEATGWQPANPQPAAAGTAWWQVYDDPVLDGLERRVETGNQTIKEAEAAYREATALTEQARAGLFPTVSLDASGTRSGGRTSFSSGTSTISTPTSTTTGTTATTTTIGTISGKRSLNQFGLSAAASWDPDIWGKIRRTIESDQAAATASLDDIAAMKLSAEGALATDYFELRVSDAQKTLLDDTVAAYGRSLKITRDQYNAGIAAKSDVLTAETAMLGGQSQDVALGVSRRQLQHAIAVLTGQPPAALTIDPAPLTETIPVVPVGVPSTLAERRPDVAEAERRMAAANAQIGVAVAAYFPTLSLTGSDGFEASQIGNLLRASNKLWSFGADLADTVIDFGARDAAVAQARATYDQTVATYRQTALTAFQQIEDNLASLAVLQAQAAVAEDTAKAADQAVALALNEYKAGTVNYTTVVTAQTTALADDQTVISVRQSRLVASVALIQALGGGWNADAVAGDGKVAVAKETTQTAASDMR